MPASSPSAPSSRTRRVIRIVVADDHATARRGLLLLLHSEGDLHVVSEADDVEAARRAVRELLPDVLLLDLHMPGGSSLDAIPAIIASSAKTAIVVLTMQDDPAFTRPALNAGARAYVLKDNADTELMSVLRQVG